MQISVENPLNTKVSHVTQLYLSFFTDICSKMFSDTLFTIDRKCKDLNIHQLHKWIMNIWIDMVAYYSSTKKIETFAHK